MKPLYEELKEFSIESPALLKAGRLIHSAACHIDHSDRQIKYYRNLAEQRMEEILRLRELIPTEYIYGVAQESDRLPAYPGIDYYFTEEDLNIHVDIIKRRVLDDIYPDASYVVQRRPIGKWETMYRVEREED
jgi:hypothetical protein